MTELPLLLRRRPTTVEARQVPRPFMERVDIARWCGGWTTAEGVAMRTDLGDRVEGKPGDWIVRGPFGDYYPVPDRVLWAQYERIVNVESE